MSWSEGFGPCTADELTELKPKNEQTDPKQFEACLHALSELVDSGSIGDPAKVRFVGAMGGHVNPDHKPLPGWSNDCMNVSVSQYREPSEQDKAANQEGSPYV